MKKTTRYVGNKDYMPNWQTYIKGGCDYTIIEAIPHAFQNLFFFSDKGRWSFFFFLSFFTSSCYRRLTAHFLPSISVSGLLLFNQLSFNPIIHSRFPSPSLRYSTLTTSAFSATSSSPPSFHLHPFLNY